MELGKAGIGRERGRFEAERVSVIRGKEEIQVYDGDKKTLSDLPEQEAEFTTRREDGIRSLTVELLTPLRMKAGNDLVTDFGFPLFFERLAQRITLLSAFYGPGKPLPDIQPLVDKAREIRVTDSKLHWYDWERYSARQKSLMRLGGLKGSITLEGGLGPFMPFLRMGEQVNVGQGTSFGLGRIEAHTETQRSRRIGELEPVQTD